MRGRGGQAWAAVDRSWIMHAVRVKRFASGGGRCNFTNKSISPERFLSSNPRFALSALSRFTPADFIARVDRAGIAWHEKVLGQLFCDGSATQIVRMLTDSMRDAGVELKLATVVRKVRLDDVFELDTDQGALRSDRLVVACGGKSIPKIGATGFGYQIAQEFGVPVVVTRPGAGAADLRRTGSGGAGSILPE